MRYRYLSVLALMTACGGAHFVPESIQKASSEPSQKNSDASAVCLNLVNGIETQEQDAVVVLETSTGYCTGTFVSDNTLFTAAHCANNTPTGGIRYKKVAPIEIAHYGKLAGSKSKVWEDFLIVIFPPNTSSSYVSLHQNPPKVGDRIMLMGFGQTDLVGDNKPDGKKRKGFNTITNISENNTILNYEAPRSHEGVAQGELAMTGRGDSGGPVFADGGGLIGIVSRGSLEPKMTEFDVNLFSTESLKLMEAAITRGAKITGIDYIRSAVDPTQALKGTAPLARSALTPSLSTNCGTETQN